MLALATAHVVLGDGERTTRQQASVSPVQRLRLGMTKGLVGRTLGSGSYVGRDGLAVAGRRDCHVYTVAGGAYSLCFRNGLLARVDPVAPALGEASIPK